jgi:ankyrin repeat protein
MNVLTCVNHLTIMFLILLICSIPAFCGEIHDAAEACDLAKLKALLKNNPKLVFSKDDLGKTPLHKAVACGFKDGVELLLANKADVNARDECGWTPLHVAMPNGRKEAAKSLLASGADVNAKTSGCIFGGGQTPLLLAAEFGRKDVAEMLLTHGADVNAKSDNGTVPLHKAVGFGRKDVAEVLLARGAKIDARDGQGETPLLLAIKRIRMIRLYNKDLVELLLANKADSNAKDRFGWTSLHFVTFYDQKDIGELLLANGADVNSKTKEGLTPLRFAAQFGHKDLVELLLGKGADINSKDEDGCTPLHFAAGNSSPREDVVKLLRQHGAAEGVKETLNDSASRCPDSPFTQRMSDYSAKIDALVKQGNRGKTSWDVLYGLTRGIADWGDFECLELLEKDLPQGLKEAVWHSVARNNATDQAKKLLVKWAKENPTVPVLMQYHPNGVELLIKMAEDKNTPVDDREMCLRYLARMHATNVLDRINALMSDQTMLSMISLPGGVIPENWTIGSVAAEVVKELAAWRVLQKK